MTSQISFHLNQVWFLIEPYLIFFSPLFLSIMFHISNPNQSELTKFYDEGLQLARDGYVIEEEQVDFAVDYAFMVYNQQPEVQS